MSKISPVKMDSRKFLGAINSGEQAKITLFEAKVEELGKSMGKNWKLASLCPNQLFIEDSESNYYVADYKREKGNRYTILNVKPIQLVESEKQDLFEKSTVQLINAIEENDQKGMACAFDKLASQRFSSRSVPASGVVKTRDGVIRNLRISNGNAIAEESRANLEAALVECVTDHVIMEGNDIVGIKFNGKKFRLPISEWVVRRAVARAIKTVAESAYRSEGFQNRTTKVASLIEHNKIEEAVNILQEFFSKQQEFCMLDRKEMQTLAENALAAKGIFNQRLCEDVGAIFYRTNARTNKDVIIREWLATAKKAGNSQLVENVDVLSRSKNFEGAYNTFLGTVFTESMSSKDIRRDTYTLALQQLRDMPRIKDSPDLAGQIQNLIENLKSPGDDAALVEAENLLANVKSHLSNEGLDDFDQMPGDSLGNDGNDLGLDDQDGADELGEMAADEIDDEADAGGKGTVVNFNITIGSEGVDVNGGDDLGGDDLSDLGGGEEDLGGDDLGGGGDDLGGEEGGMGGFGGGEEEEENNNFGFESKTTKKTISEEWEKPWLKDKDKKGDDDDSESDSDSADLDDDSDEPYAFEEVEGQVGLDYGIPPISEEDCNEVVNMLPEGINTFDEKGMRNAIVKAITKSGLAIPQTKMESAIVQIFKTMSESQRKLPVRRKRGFKKTRLTTDELKEHAPVTSDDDSIVWGEVNESKAVGQYRGVKFSMSFAENLMESDSGYSIDVPQGIMENVAAITRRESVDAAPVFEFLDATIEQIREFDEVEDNDITEAVAEIANSMDGLTVRVPPGTKIELTPEASAPVPGAPGAPMGPGAPGDAVGDIANSMGDADGDVMPPEGDSVGGGEEDMVNVNDLPGTEGDGEDGEDGALDFDGEGGLDGADDTVDGADDEAPVEGAPKPPKPEGELEEDNDITNPKSPKYNTAKDDHRKKADAKQPKFSDGKLDGFDKDEGQAANAGGVKMNKVTPRSKK